MHDLDPGVSAFIQLLLRWFHIFAGLVWIGHLYFFNFVNVQFQAALEKELKPKVNPGLLLRALWWFRWGAFWTFAFGIVLFMIMYGMGGYLWDADRHLSARGIWMLLGGSIGIIMLLNVWFVIWPAQKQIIGGLMGVNPPASPDVPKRALLFSRINLWLSAPMLMGMIAASHIDMWSAMPPYLHGVFLLLGWGAIHGLLSMAPKKGLTL
jgi:uncharacterized membrane protein